ncbi:MAG: hypothetical protein ACREYE_14340 [Gammaproteobacteria bacterium]
MAAFERGVGEPAIPLQQQPLSLERIEWERIQRGADRVMRQIAAPETPNGREPYYDGDGVALSGEALQHPATICHIFNLKSGRARTPVPVMVRYPAQNALSSLSSGLMRTAAQLAL